MTIHLSTAWLPRCPGESRGGAPGRLEVCWAAASHGGKSFLPARLLQQLAGRAPYTPDRYVALLPHDVFPAVPLADLCAASLPSSAHHGVCPILQLKIAPALRHGFELHCSGHDSLHMILINAEHRSRLSCNSLAPIFASFQAQEEKLAAAASYQCVRIVYTAT